MAALTTCHASPLSRLKETSTKAPTRLARSPRPWVTLFATSSRTTTGGGTGGEPRSARLRFAEGNVAVLNALRPALGDEILQVRQGLRQCEASFVERERIAKDFSRDGERGPRLVAQGAVHEVEALLVVQEELIYAPVEVVEEGTVSGEDEVRVEPPQARQALQVAGEGTSFRVGPEPDVRCDLEHDVVGGEEYFSSPVVQHDLIIRVSGGVKDAGYSGSELYLLPLLQREYLPR